MVALLFEDRRYFAGSGKGVLTQGLSFSSFDFGFEVDVRLFECMHSSFLISSSVWNSATRFWAALLDRSVSFEPEGVPWMSSISNPLGVA